MARVLLNLDLGELPEEPEELYLLAQIACVACGGHAGDEASMARAVGLVARAGTVLAAHPSYPDREGFGRRRLQIAPVGVRALVAAQCSALLPHATRAGVRLHTVKPHGALYHAADADPATAAALVVGAMSVLGPTLAVIGPASGALEAAAHGHGAGFLREALLDRGVRLDGSLIPRGEPGALVTDHPDVLARLRLLVRAAAVETVGIHGDTPGALALAREVRAALARFAAG